MNCETARNDFAIYLYGELDFNQEEALEKHLDGCPQCRQELERERVLVQMLDQGEHQPSPELLQACRRELRSRVTAIDPAQGRPWWHRLTRRFDAIVPSSAVLRPAGALALLVVGFIGGKIYEAKVSFEPSVVRVRNLNSSAGGAIQLVLEEVRERTMTGRVDDSKIQRMLLAAASDPSDPGLRARTLDILKDNCERGDVRRALLQALQSDTNAGVRLKAIEGLKPFAADPDTRKVLSSVLLADDNPGIRAQAIDLLVLHMQSDTIGTLQESIIREQNPYIRQKSAKALRDINASVETF